MAINYVDAILGCEVDVPTLTGKVVLKIPAGTHTGQVFRLKSKGIPKAGGYGTGDMLVKILVDIPDKLSAKQKELIVELSKLSDETPLVKDFKDKTAQVGGNIVLKNRFLFNPHAFIVGQQLARQPQGLPVFWAGVGRE